MLLYHSRASSTQLQDTLPLLRNTIQS